MPLKIELDLKNIGIEEDPETGELFPGDGMEQKLLDAIIDRMFNGQYSPLRIEALLKKAEQRIDERIDAVIEGELMGFISGPIQRHDKFDGKPLGEPTSVKELAMLAVEKYLIAPPQVRDGYSRDKVGNLAELVDLLVKEALNKELKPAIEDAKKLIKETVLEKALAGAVAALAPVVK